MQGEGTADAVFFVLGMHRSGTSCLTASLEQCGVYVGEVQRRSSFQPRGNLERANVVDVNNALLSSAGGTWRDPPDEPCRATADQALVIKEIVAELEDHAPSALKDPRLLFTLDEWTSAAHAPRLVGTFRRPAAVAASLRERDRIPADEALRLWCRYNERLVELHRELGFPLIEFDLRDREGYCTRMSALAAELGLVPLVGPIHRVVDRAWSRTMVDEDASLPDRCSELYDYLSTHRFEGLGEPDGFAAALVELGEAHDGRTRLTAGELIRREREWVRRGAVRFGRATLGPIRRRARRARGVGTDR